MAEAGGAGSDLDCWLEPFLAALGHKKRRTWAPLYLRGLLGPSERKSLQPMAASLGLSGHDQLQHFIASRAWDDGPLWRVLAEQADRLVGGPKAALVIDDTALPKKGTLSVGVARQYCGQLGKRANCQALVSLTLAGQEVPVPVGLRLFLPAEWTSDAERCAAAGVPDEEMEARTKGEIALAELDRLIAADVRFGVVLADAGYGASAAFRYGLSERGLTWAVGIPRNQKVYGADVQLVPPTGRKRRPTPDQEPCEVEAVLADLPWRRVTWRHGTKGPLAARFTATRVRVGDGKTWANNRHLPGAEVWLVGEWRSNGERKYYLSNLPPRTPLHALAAAIKARWVCEQAHQQLKQELGLGHFEGRSWTGLHRHALMTSMACAYLQHLRLAGQRPARSGKNTEPRSGTATIPDPASGAPRHHGAAVRRSLRLSSLPTLPAQTQATT
jgi:SRSO17 transposase